MKEEKYGTRYKSNDHIDDDKIVRRKGMKFILNKTIESSEDRLKLVEGIIDDLGEDNLKASHLRAMSDYLIDATVKERGERKGPIMTANRMVTIRNRETSSDALIDNKLEGGENTFHQLISKNPKNSILTHKTGITDEDIQNIPGLKLVVETINYLVGQLDKGIKEGRDVRYLRKTIIELRKNQYDIKNSYNQPMHLRSNINSYGEQKEIDMDFANLETVKSLLNNYLDIHKNLKNNDLGSDTYVLLTDFEDLLKEVFDENPEYKDVVILKMMGYNNSETAKIISEKCSKKCRSEYVGKIFRDIVPMLIVQKATK